MLVLRTDWRAEYVRASANCREVLSVSVREINRRTAADLLRHFHAYTRVVCRTDEEMGILHAALQELDVPLFILDSDPQTGRPTGLYPDNMVCVPDPPIPDEHPLVTPWDDEALVVEQIIAEEPQGPMGWRFALYALQDASDIPF